MIESDLPPLITSRFTIRGDDLDPRRCTEVLKLVPTEIAIKGTERPDGRPGIRTSYWLIDIKDKSCYSLEEGISEILEILWPSRAEIVDLLLNPGITASFESSVKIYKDRPEYCLEPETIQRIAFFNVPYCFEIFDYT